MVEFEWDEANLEHIARHGVDAPEAEAALDSRHRVVVGRRDVAGEERISLVGATDEGRVLKVVYAWRGTRIRVVTAHDPTPGEIRRWRRMRRK